MSIFVVLAICAGLASCGPKVDPEIDAVARVAYQKIRTNDPGLSALLAPEMKTPEAIAALPNVRSYIPKESPKAIKAVQWTTFYPAGGADVTATVRHAYQFEGRRAVVTTTLRKKPATHDWKVTGFNIWVATEKELAVNQLTLADKRPAQYAFLAGVILAPMLTIAAIVKLVATKGRRRRLWWILPAVVGVCMFQMNWATGAVSVQPFYFQLLGAGATTTPTGFDPWILSFSLPIVAILILFGVIGRARSKPAESS